MELLSTGQMIHLLRVDEEAEYKYEDRMTEHHIVVRKTKSGSIIIVKNGRHTDYIGKELELSARIMSYKWSIIPHYVTFYEAMKVHDEEKKTITFHLDDELKYEFVNELETNQFHKLALDNICLHELIRGKWTIEN